MIPDAWELNTHTHTPFVSLSAAFHCPLCNTWAAPQAPLGCLWPQPGPGPGCPDEPERHTAVTTDEIQHGGAILWEDTIHINQPITHVIQLTGSSFSAFTSWQRRLLTSSCNWVSAWGPHLSECRFWNSFSSWAFCSSVCSWYTYHTWTTVFLVRQIIISTRQMNRLINTFLSIKLKIMWPEQNLRDLHCVYFLSNCFTFP